MNKETPTTLRRWFVIHFFIDMMVGIPLFFFPEWFLGILGWTQVDTLMTRIVGAAFFGIGVESYLGRNASMEVFKGMLNLKIIWSATATFGIGWSFLEGSQGNPLWVFLTLATFLLFHINWIYWRVRINKL